MNLGLGLFVKDLKVLTSTKAFIFLNTFGGDLCAKHSHFLSNVSSFREAECHILGIDIKDFLEMVKVDVGIFVDGVRGNGNVFWYFGGDIWT